MYNNIMFSIKLRTSPFNAQLGGKPAGTPMPAILGAGSGDEILDSVHGLVSNPDPSLSRSAGCIASPARGRNTVIQRCGKGEGSGFESLHMYSRSQC